MCEKMEITLKNVENLKLELMNSGHLDWILKVEIERNRKLRSQTNYHKKQILIDIACAEQASRKGDIETMKRCYSELKRNL